MNSAPTIIGVTRDGCSVIAASGIGTTSDGIIIKRKAKRIFTSKDYPVLFATTGTTQVSKHLWTEFEKILAKSRGDIHASAAKLSESWNSNSLFIGHMFELIVCNERQFLYLDSVGNLYEPDTAAIAIGEGGKVALGAGIALCHHTDWTANKIARESMRIASELLSQTPGEFVIEEVRTNPIN